MMLITLLHGICIFRTFVKTNPNTMKNNTNEILLKMAQIRCKWKFKSHTNIYEAHYGQLTEKERKDVHAVWSLHKADKKIVDNFAKILEWI